MDPDQLRIADACAWSMIIAPSGTTHFGAGLGVYATRTFRRGEATGSYYGTLVKHELTSSEHTREV